MPIKAMTRIVLATGNAGKVAEMQNELETLGVQIIPQTDYDFVEATEDGLSFVENAIKKARHACKHTQLPAIADDSGLEVDALDGAPGIHSARYATQEDIDGNRDDANNRKLLEALDGVTDRRARFQCVLVYMQHETDPTPIICQGTWEGEIGHSPTGDYGFGYDPLFFLPEHQCYSAELKPAEKKRLSHRAQALVKLKRSLSNLQFSKLK